MPPRSKSARARVHALPRPAWHASHDAVARLAPSGRSLLVGFGLIAVAAGLYVGARTTSVFAVRTVEVRGAGPADAARVRHALAPLVGQSLLGVGGDDVELRVLGLPEVARVSFDRAYPHTLRVTVVPELPTVVVRRGAESWLVSGRGRVLRKIPRGSAARLPRVWVPRDSELARGATADAAAGSEAAHAMAVLGSAGFRVPVAVSGRPQRPGYGLDGRTLGRGEITAWPAQRAVQPGELASSPVAGTARVLPVSRRDR